MIKQGGKWLESGVASRLEYVSNGLRQLFMRQVGIHRRVSHATFTLEELIYCRNWVRGLGQS